MLGSVLAPSKPPGLRRNSISTAAAAPPLPPRRNSLATAPAAQTAKLQVKVTTLPPSPPLNGKMDHRYRPSSPRGRYANPARSSTGTFQDPYNYSTYYARPSSPRSSGERVGGYHQTSYHPSSSIAPRVMPSSSSYGRPRRNTGEAMARPSSVNTSMPIRSPYTPHSNIDHHPSSPLAQSRDKRGDTYISHGPSRTTHKKIYSVDDATHSAQLVAATDIEANRHRESLDRGYATSGGRNYHSNTKPPARLTDLGDDGYSYTDPASMYRDTEPAWRRPRSGSLERTSRPSSMIMDRPARNSTRELGPPPSTRGFDKVNNAISRTHGRSSSIDRSREIPKYDAYPDTAPVRTSSTRHHTPAIHQDSREREHRRDTYNELYDRRDREPENRRQNTYEDAHVSSRGFGIAPGDPALAHDHHALDRQPIWNNHEVAQPRANEYGSQAHSSYRADARAPESRSSDPRSSDSRSSDPRSSDTRPSDPRSSASRLPEPRSSRDRDLAPAYDSYDKRPRERESSSSYVPVVAGAATGVAAGIGAASYMKSREDRNSSEERERERRREHDERDRRDKHDDRRERRDDRERKADERRDVPPPSAPTPVNNPPYPPTQDADRKPRERRYEDDEREKKSLKKAPSPEGSGDERPRHYVDRDTERKTQAPIAESTLDPDEEYRRRIQQEAERSSRANRDRDSDSDRERDRRRRKDDRERSRGAEDRSRYDERSSSIYDNNLTQEPESIDKLNADQPSNKQVTIVTPPKDAPPAVRGILRRPTEKFPEDPEPIREGVAPHKDALKGKDIPVGARWTRIDRRLVNPEALEEAKERFEERMDCVIVLRVLTKQEIQKLADRTRKLRERRGMNHTFARQELSNSSAEDELDRRERDERDQDDNRDRDRDREHRSSRDDEEERDRDRGRDKDRDRRRYDDDESDYDDLARQHDRERNGDRERPRVLEPAR